MAQVSSDGVKISYDVGGEGRPLIMLHGWVCDRTWWTEPGYTDDLRRDHRVINVDLRGFGASDKPHDPSAYRFELLTHDVLAVADAEGIDRFALWGQSYGGEIAWMTAYSAPDRVAALISGGAWDPRPLTYEEWKEPLGACERELSEYQIGVRRNTRRADAYRRSGLLELLRFQRRTPQRKSDS